MLREELFWFVGIFAHNTGEVIVWPLLLIDIHRGMAIKLGVCETCSCSFDQKKHLSDHFTGLQLNMIGVDWWNIKPKQKLIDQTIDHFVGIVCKLITRGFLQFYLSIFNHARDSNLKVIHRGWVLNFFYPSLINDNIPLWTGGPSLATRMPVVIIGNYVPLRNNISPACCASFNKWTAIIIIHCVMTRRWWVQTEHVHTLHCDWRAGLGCNNVVTRQKKGHACSPMIIRACGKQSG